MAMIREAGTDGEVIAMRGKSLALVVDKGADLTDPQCPCRIVDLASGQEYYDTPGLQAVLKWGYWEEPGAEKQVEKLTPRGQPLPPWGDEPVPISEADIDLAIEEWNEKVPEAAGLLEATSEIYVG